VGNLPVAASAALALGQQKGFFTEAGLELTIKPTEAPSMVPSLLSNQIQFAFLNPPAILIARSNGVPVKGVETAARYDPDPAKAAIALLVGKDSAIKSPADLVDKTVAVDAIGQVPHLSILNALRSSGVDPAKVKFTEIPFPAMGAALESGRVAGVVAAEPFITVNTAKGAQVLLPGSKGLPPGTPQSLWFTTDSYAKKSPDVIAKFRTAIDKSQTYAQAHPDEVRKIIPTYTQVEQALADKILLPNYEPGYTKEQWDAWYTVLRTEGLIKKEIDPAEAYLPQ
jgi:NitT/TauT family transport system substrate-binding protein